MSGWQLLQAGLEGQTEVEFIRSCLAPNLYEHGVIVYPSILRAPSKRILNIFEPGIYSKTEHGPLIAEEIGVDQIRVKCPQFDEWVQHLQGWGC